MVAEEEIEIHQARVLLEDLVVAVVALSRLQPILEDLETLHQYRRHKEMMVVLVEVVVVILLAVEVVVLVEQEVHHQQLLLVVREVREVHLVLPEFQPHMLAVVVEEDIAHLFLVLEDLVVVEMVELMLQME